MAIKDGIRALLIGQSSITSLCPAQTIGGRIVNAFFVDKVFQGIKPPYVIVSRTGSNPLGTLANTTGIRSTDIDVDCFADTETLAEALAEAVSAVLKDYTGAAGASDTIDAVQWEDTNDFQNPEVGQDLWRHAVTLTFSIFHH